MRPGGRRRDARTGYQAQGDGQLDVAQAQVGVRDAVGREQEDRGTDAGGGGGEPERLAGEGRVDSQDEGADGVGDERQRDEVEQQRGQRRHAPQARSTLCPDTLNMSTRVAVSTVEPGAWGRGSHSTGARGHDRRPREGSLVRLGE